MNSGTNSNPFPGLTDVCISNPLFVIPNPRILFGRRTILLPKAASKAESKNSEILRFEHYPRSPRTARAPNPLQRVSSPSLQFSLKPENILIGGDGYAKLTDFGLSKENVSPMEGANSLLGTPEYIAPEILLGQTYGQASDWWAFGCVVYEMVKGVPPFYDKNRNRMFKKIVNQSTIEWGPQFDEVTIDFITKLIDKNPETRLGSSD
jgi:serine/threonine protein kinase